jgi:phosphoglycerate dehydrogenase-like enzyme
VSERPAILCSPAFARTHGAELAAAGADHGLVTVDEHDRPAEAALARVELAFFSPDLYPGGVRAFFGAASRAPNLRWFHTSSAGVDHPIFDQIRAGGAQLTTSSGAAAPAIARTVVMYLLALSRDLPGQLRRQAAHEWSPRRFDDLEGRSIGVVGMGPIGLEVIRLAAALGMAPIGMRRQPHGDEPCPTWPLWRFAELAADVDVLVLALPLTPETSGILTREVIDGMRSGALVVNVGRGDLVDESALADALARGHLGGAGLDVFVTEPLPPESPLWDLPNVIITPHSSATTVETDQRAIAIFFENLRAYVAGRPLRNEVTA